MIAARAELARERGVRAAPPRSAAGWLAFDLLALYGTLRWATMLEGGARLRVFAALGVVLCCTWVLAALLRRGSRRGPTALVTFVAFLGLVALAGYPLAWLYGLRISRFAARVGHGIATMNGLLIPYRGHDPATPAVLILGGALLLLLGGLAFATVRATPVSPRGVPAAPATGRRALAALPLVVLAIVPSAVVAPQVSYLHGLILFGLVAALVLAPRFPARRAGGGVVLLGLAMVAGTAAAAAVAGHQRWLRVGTSQAIGGRGGGPTVAFDWQQSYGRSWPHTGATVLYVSAPRPTYWKTEDLDRFNGVRWVQARGAVGLLDVSAANRRAYTEPITVEVGAMDSDQVITAGVAERPALLGSSPGSDAGTWVSDPSLGPGSRYRDRVYAPDPPAAVLARAGTHYPAAMAPFRSLPRLTPAYARVTALARSLGRDARTPYAYVQAVIAYLGHGFTYTLDPPAGGRDPLADFLLTSRRGYCQQFAGATALLLRLHGIPARVAVGFTPGRHVGGDSYEVGDTDAHAWVEVWFPRIGWVTFDPTPGTPEDTGRLGPGGVAPAALARSRGAAARAAARRSKLAATRTASQATRAHGERGGASNAPARTSGPGGQGLVIGLLGAGGAVFLGLLAVLLRGYRRRLSVPELTAELERAFIRCGRPLPEHVTLAALEAGLGDSPAAAAYVRALAAARFAPGAPAPPARGRAALRRRLARSAGGRRGPLGWLRAFLALPPRRGSTAPLAP